MPAFAILIDYENFSCPPEGVKRFLADFSCRGSIVVKRAYANWVRFSAHRQQFLASQIEMIEMPNATKGKNNADIRLVVDAMELVFTKPYINTFVIASADSDFLPLLSRLREYNKQTIVVASDKNSHSYMRTHCDQFVNGDQYLVASAKTSRENPANIGRILPQASPATTKAPSTNVPTSEQLLLAYQLILQAWEIHGLDKPVSLAGLGSLVRKNKTEVDWREYGVKSLKPLVAYLVTNGFLSIDLSNGSTERIYLTSQSNSFPHNSRSLSPSLVSIVASEKHQPDSHTAEVLQAIQTIVGHSMRWDELQNSLLDLCPHWMEELNPKDDFLKLLQSLDACGCIELSFSSEQETYFVSCPRNGSTSSQTSAFETAPNKSSWTQLQLFRFDHPASDC